jgi:hypothetical protein
LSRSKFSWDWEWDEVSNEKELAEKGHEGAFDGDRNIQYVNCGGGQMTAIHCKHLPNCILLLWVNFTIFEL